MEKEFTSSNRQLVRCRKNSVFNLAKCASHAYRAIVVKDTNW